MTDKSKSDLIESAAKRNCRTTMIYTLPEGLDFVFRCISSMRSHHTLQLSIQLLFELGNRSLASLWRRKQISRRLLPSFLPRCLIDDAEFSAHAKTRQTSDGRYLYFITWEEFPQFFRPLSPFLSLFPSFEITPGIEELISHRARGDPLARILVFLFRSTTC